MRILITGGSGLLGQYVNIELAKEHEILTLFNNKSGNTTLFNSANIDITKNEKLKEVFENFRPEAVIHLAAVASVQNAHAGNRGKVYEINVNATENISKLCTMYNCKLIYSSTDLVYAGYRGEFLKENSKKDPRSLYSETKLIGEAQVIRNCENYLILRIALLFGHGLYGRYNHFGSTFEKFRRGESVNLFYDQYRSPLELSDTARMINQLLNPEFTGMILNVGGSERVSRVDMAEILCEESGLPKSLINSISLYDIPGIPDVQDVSLDISIMKDAGINPSPIGESIRRVLNSYHNT